MPRRVALAWCALALSVAAAAQDAPVAAARATATFEALPITADELPQDWILEQELACASPTAAKFLAGTAVAASAGAPKRSAHQTLGGASGRGSILYFEFEGDVPQPWIEGLVTQLWSEKGEPTRTQPELVARAGNTFVVISCSLNSPLRRFACDRLRKRFGLRLPDSDDDRRRALAPLARAAAAGDREGGLRILAARRKEFLGLSLAAFYEAQLHVAGKQWLDANVAFAKALALDAATDPLPDNALHYQCVDGRGQAYYRQQKWAEAVATLREAAELARALGRPRARAASLYNAACSLALAGDGDAAMAELEQALALAKDELLPQARSDADLESLRSRADWSERIR